jgi:hypothetical protein
VDASHFDGGAGSEVLSDANLAEAECTLRIKVASDAGAVTLAGARLYVCDVFGATRAIPDVEVQAFERGRRPRPGRRSTTARASAATTAASGWPWRTNPRPPRSTITTSPSRRGPLRDALPIINLGFYLDTVSGGAYAQRHTQTCRMAYTSASLTMRSGHRQQRQPAGIIADLLGVEWELGRRGSSSFSFTIPYDSNARDLLETYDLVKIKRGNGDLLDAAAKSPSTSWPRTGGRGDDHRLGPRSVLHPR